MNDDQTTGFLVIFGIAMAIIVLILGCYPDFIVSFMNESLKEMSNNIILKI